jgi:hypothetical protein
MCLCICELENDTQVNMCTCCSKYGCGISSSHSSTAKDSSLLGCYTLSLCEWLPTLLRIVMLDSEVEGTMILQNSGNYLPNSKVSHS